MPRALLALFTACALVVSACGADEDSPTTEAPDEKPLGECNDTVEGVEVAGTVGEKPTIDLTPPFSVDESSCEVLVEGDGDKAEDGDIVVFDYVYINGRDGSEYASSYELQDVSVPVDQGLPRGVRLGLTGAKAGSRVVVAIAPDDGYGLRGGDPAKGLTAEDTLVFVADIHDVRRPLKRAEGEPVAPVPGLPTVVLGPNGAPAITVPSGTPPAELVVQLLIEGEGEPVEAGQAINVHYTGVIWGTGAIFDTTWDEDLSPFPFVIGAEPRGVIAGWDRGLLGQKVGSQVLLVIPPADGYGEAGQAAAGISGTDTLVFVVDILDARTP